MSKSEKNIRLVTMTLTLCLVIVGLWYAWETRGLKIQAKEQLAEMRKQFQLSIVPSLFPSVVHKDNVKELIMEEIIKQTSGEKIYSKEELSEVIKYYIYLENLADIMAYDVRVFIFDGDTKSYLKAGTAYSFVKPKVNQSLAIFSDRANYLDEKGLISELNKLYNLNLDSLKDYILGMNNEILLFFKDVQGNAYLRTREFLYDEQNNRLQGRVVLHELEQKVQ